MIKWLYGIIAGIGAIVAVFFAGRQHGKQAEQTQILKQGVEDAQKTKQARHDALHKADDSDIDDVVDRVSNYTNDW